LPASNIVLTQTVRLLWVTKANLSAMKGRLYLVLTTILDSMVHAMNITKRGLTFRIFEGEIIVHVVNMTMHRIGESSGIKAS